MSICHRALRGKQTGIINLGAVPPDHQPGCGAPLSHYLQRN
jgi:hypothetical protein